jgi:hypothetical protein
VNRNQNSSQDTTIKKQHQPLAAISIQDLNSVQLRRTDTKMLGKTFSAPTRSISMQCLSSTNEQFLTQKIDLIAELKMSKDITGIRKMKVERAKMDRGSEVYSDQFTIENFIDTVNAFNIKFFCLVLSLSLFSLSPNLHHRIKLTTYYNMHHSHC